MSLQILGGMAKGHRLTVPDTDAVRPTSVMLRRRIFDSHQDCSGEIFVDLFAGSGAVGLEAASRGAEKIIFCETNQKCLKILKTNCDQFSKKFSDSQIMIHSMSAIQFIKKMTSEWDRKESEMIIFIDPPYEQHQLYFELLEELRPNYSGKLWIESDTQKGPSEEELSKYLREVHKVYKQGTNFVIVANF